MLPCTIILRALTGKASILRRTFRRHQGTKLTARLRVQSWHTVFDSRVVQVADNPSAERCISRYQASITIARRLFTGRGKLMKDRYVCMIYTRS
ncbi:uncharacterized protein LACBIDRAFT_301533 [Laccaria bicolor S238N-H82]|uniref:Predicted protein n=1 Tax=Laccaria bicolor (strain S238N-H82 / ATCC MYA-4686) TaxID=486041 RepID=B0CNR6_LACBS|nr:uncharacterized protein LACBIDRAFT_301533 [Laccaria bicolor S238N-H82]EDR15983.1 predicted protein [Laccaria bicolor S238N-H82]|eukprot:XP_001874191.1 predicted protein [Laccaria bicolor S238N-H82]